MVLFLYHSGIHTYIYIYIYIYTYIHIHIYKVNYQSHYMVGLIFKCGNHWKISRRVMLTQICVSGIITVVSTDKFVYRLTISPCYSSIPLILEFIGRDGSLSTLCHSFGFACQQRMLKTFSGPRNLRYEDRVVWPWYLLVSLYIWLTISSCCSSIPLTLGLIRRDGGLRTLCHSYGLACQQRMLKTFADPG